MIKLKNERVTENIVAKYYKQYKNLDIHYQYPVKGASKNNENNTGFIDLLITDKSKPNFCMIVECKKNTKDHIKAEDETKHYAECLKDIYKEQVLCAVSGTSEDVLKCTMQVNGCVFERNSLVPLKIVLDTLYKDETRDLKTEEDLTKYAKWLHNYLRDNIALTEEQKPLLLSAIMIALRDEAFDYEKRELFDVKESLDWRRENSRLLAGINEALNNILKKSDIPKDKHVVLLQTVGFINTLPTLHEQEENNHTRLYNIVSGIDEHLFTSTHRYSDLDLIGKFYGEFIRYTGGDGKGLGIVLTPSHVADLMCDLAELTVDDVVYDPCTGTGRFLVTAMHKMLNMTEDENKRKAIQSRQLVGVEQQSSLYTMAAANMIFRGDGKANLHNGSCFNLAPMIKDYKPTIAILNPPYSQKQVGLKEWDFILHACNMVKRGGKVVAIVPKSVFIDKKNEGFKERLLNEHTLETVISMSGDLFQSAATTTAIVVIKVGVPNSKKNKTYFYDFTNDGYKTIIRQGRLDINYKEAKAKLFECFDNKVSIPGISAYEHVKYDDEWILESYVEIDYGKLTPELFITKQINEFIKAFKADPFGRIITTLQKPTIELDYSNWKSFNFYELFIINRGKSKALGLYVDGETPVVSASSINNGISKHVNASNVDTIYHPQLTISNNGAVLDTFYQAVPFIATSDVYVVNLRNTELTENIGLFLKPIIELLKIKYSYGRKASLSRINNETIKLPVTPEGTPDWAFMEEYMNQIKGK